MKLSDIVKMGEAFDASLIGNAQRSALIAGNDGYISNALAKVYMVSRCDPDALLMLRCVLENVFARGVLEGRAEQLDPNIWKL